MKTLTLKLPNLISKSYKILMAPGLIDDLPKVLSKLKRVARYVIITDSNVKKLYGTNLAATLKRAGFPCSLLTFPAGEKNKTEATHQKLTHQMLAKKCGRDTMILALGGGVVGDMAGYVAATYMRGIPFVQIPTSSLAMIDSSVGGKVGADTPYGKNLVGAFWHPEAVIVDVEFLMTLPEIHLINGLIEAVKIFLTSDKTSFEFIRKNWKKVLEKNPQFLQKIIAIAIELKINIVVRDEHEANERMVINWGHTIGHAVEHLSGFKILHGYSVALGILAESKIAEITGVLSAQDFKTILGAMKQFGIDDKQLQKFKRDDIVNLTRMDKKNRNGKVKYILLERIGKVKTTNGIFGHEVDPKIVTAAIKFFKKTPKISNS